MDQGRAQFRGDAFERTKSAVEHAGKFVDTINDICGKLEFLQDLGDKLTEVGYDAVSFRLLNRSRSICTPNSLGPF
jgi:hypothetical protein